MRKKKYEYKFVRLGEGAFGVKRTAKAHYQETVHQHARDGWRLVQIFSPGTGIHEWSVHYGDKVSGWWFDGGYPHIHFNEAIASLYADAVKRGNPKAIVTFNPGVMLKRHTQAEDYTAGELNDPFEVVPASRWVNGSQWHALTFLGSTWGQRNVRQPTERWREWFQKVVAQGGVVTLDMGPNWDPKAGPIGAIDQAQAEQFRAIAQP